jgi:hypothetical protein
MQHDGERDLDKITIASANEKGHSSGGPFL